MSELFLDGIVEDIIYTNAENGYTVCVINCRGEPVTAVGIMPYINEGESISVRGAWQMHASFGRQFKVEYFEKKLPTTASAILSYLSSGAIKGVGPVTAAKIVETFGEKSLEIIEDRPRWLCDIPGISPKKADSIHENYSEQFGLRAIMLQFQGFFGPAIAVKIFRKYGSNAIDIIKENPYRLCSDISGIGFEKADMAAIKLGFSPSAPERIQAGVVYTLELAAYDGGHCFLPKERLITAAAKVLKVDESAVEPAIEKLCEEETLVKTGYNNTIIIALKYLYQAERDTAAKLSAMAEYKFPYQLEGVNEQIDVLEKKYDITYAEEQRNAIILSVTNGVTVITGGPGTGKTTVIKAVLDIFDTLKLTYMLAAPTGRAAKRMNETSGREAKTIHRLLEMTYGEDDFPNFARDEDNPLNYNAIIIDEVSMVDSLLMAALLKAVKLGTYLILIGDSDQLPPVGAGNALSDIIESDAFGVVKLNKIFRQAQKSLIVMNAHAINEGKLPELKRKDSDFFFIEKQDPEVIRDTLISLCTKRLPKHYGVSPFDDIQVISCTKKGVLGTYELNKVMQEALNPQNGHLREKQIGGKLFRENDKVMQVKNNYDLVWKRGGTEGTGIFNGDIGRIISVDTHMEVMKIDFDGRITDYAFALLDELEHAYAITVHKSQGSEYKFVVIPAFMAPYQLMTRNLLYTAITRARELVCIVGTSEALSTMVQNNRKPLRYTALKGMLKAL